MSSVKKYISVAMATAFAVCLIATVLTMNVSAQTDTITLPVVGENVVNGDTPAKTAEFKFEMKATDSAYPMPEGSVNGEKTVAVTGAGNIDFGSITFTTVGFYYYDVSEVNVGEKGYTYDEKSYRITVYVLHGDSGELDIQVVIKENDTNFKAEKIVFTNKYELSQTTVPTTETPTTTVATTTTEFTTTTDAATTTELQNITIDVATTVAAVNNDVMTTADDGNTIASANNDKADDVPTGAAAVPLTAIILACGSLIITYRARKK